MKFMREKPKHKAVRVLTRFAWLPTRVNREVTVWLESYAEKQQYHLFDDGIRGWWFTSWRSVVN